jgi:hypothetical protein
MNTIYKRPDRFKKLNTKEVLEAMINGAILVKTYGVYSYWSLEFSDGSKHYNIRKGAAQSATSSKNVVLIEANKHGASYKITQPQ